MNKKPRIAFCFSGQARTLNQTYIFFERNLFNAAIEQGFDYDVFCAVEDDSDVEKIKLLKPTKVKKIKSDFVEKIIEERYGRNFEETILGDKYMLAPKLNQSVHDNLYNILQQFYKFSESVKLEKNYRNENNINYEIVMRLRYDCFLLRKINFKKIISVVRKNTLICNKTTVGDLLIDYRKINDHFFIGNSESFDLIRDLFYNFKEGFSGNEVKSKKIFEKIDKFENLIKNFNTKLGFRLLPVEPIAAIGGFFCKRLSAESIYYNYFIKKNINIKKKKFSFILLRNKIGESKWYIEKKNMFEIK